MDILPRKPSFTYIVNLRANPVNVPKFITVVSLPNASTSSINERDYEQSGLNSKLQKTTQNSKHEVDNLNSAVGYRPPEWQDKQDEWHNPVKSSDKNSVATWQEDLAIPEESSVSNKKIILMFTPFNSMWDGPFGSVKVVQHRIGKQKTDKPPILSDLVRAGFQARGVR